MNFRNTLLAVGVALTTCGAAALSLGESRGTVVLGRPLNLVFELQLDTAESADDACVTANISLGDNRLADSSVRITAMPAQSGRAPAVRVRSAGVVNEPIVTVQMSAGCSGKISRTYTFLADLPDTVAPTAAPIAIATLVRPGQQANSDAQPSSTRRPARAPVSVVEPTLPSAQEPPAPPAPKASTPRPAAAPRSAAPTVPAPPPQRARLVIEPLDLLPPPPAGLRLSSELAHIPDEALTSQRAEAAAAWRVLSSSPDELLKSLAAADRSAADLAALRASTAQEKATIAGLRERLESTESESFPAWMVYALLALLAVVLAAAAWMWQRARAPWSPAWRDSAAPSHEGDAEAVFGAANLPAAAPAPADLGALAASSALDTAQKYAAPPATPSAALPGSPGGAPELQALDATAPVRVAPPPAQSTLEAALPAAPPVRVINPEALFDLQQQAEFFVSVGEHDQAIEVMKQHIAENEQSSPLAYLDLLRLYHSLSRIGDFNALRTQFLRYFNAQVPEFAGFNRPGRTLLGYTESLASIEAQWSDNSVLEQLEAFLFRHGGAATPSFDLTAYEDLLLLYAIAQTTPASARGAPPPRERTTPEDAVVSEGIGALPAAKGHQKAPQSSPLPESLPEMGLPALDLIPAVAVAAAPAEISLADYDFPWELETPAPRAEETMAPSPIDIALDAAYPTPPLPGPSLDAPAAPEERFPPAMLDLDLTAPHQIPEMDFPLMDFPLPSLTLQDVPAVPVTPPPEPGQPLGFGAASDRFEVRFELADDLLAPAPSKSGKDA